METRWTDEHNGAPSCKFPDSGVNSEHIFNKEIKKGKLKKINNVPQTCYKPECRLGIVEQPQGLQDLQDLGQ